MRKQRGKNPFFLTQLLKFEMGEREKGKMGTWFKRPSKESLDCKSRSPD